MPMWLLLFTATRLFCLPFFFQRAIFAYYDYPYA